MLYYITIDNNTPCKTTQLLTLINNPVYYYRQFENDLKSFNDDDKHFQTCKKIVETALPFIALYRPLGRAISITMGNIRSFSYLPDLIKSLKQKHYSKASFSFIQASVAALCVANSYFNNVKGMIITTLNDFLLNLYFIAIGIKEGKFNQNLLDHIFSSINNSLYLAMLTYGGIEFVVASLAFQVVFEMYHSLKEFNNKNQLKTITHFIMAIIRTFQLSPQKDLLFWKYIKSPSCVGEVKQAENGFLYLDVDDSYIKELNELFKSQGMELPPYFGEGRAGAHISIMSGYEGKNIQINPDDLGKKISFKINHFDSLTPDGLKGVKTVSFIAVDSQELENLREKYNLSSKIEETHDFHITTGVKYKA